MREKLSAPNCEDEPKQTKGGDQSHIHPPRPQTESHDQRHRNGHGNCKNAPRTAGQRLHHYERKHGQQDDHDRQHADERQHANAAPDLFFHHLTKCFAASSHRCEQHDHVVHTAAQRRPDQDPERAWQKTKLRRQHRTNQRPRPGDGGKMMTENHPAVGRHKIFAVVLHHSRCRTLVV